MAGHLGSGFARGARSARIQRDISSTCSGSVSRGASTRMREPRASAPRCGGHILRYQEVRRSPWSTKLPVWDEARRPHPWFQVQQHPNIPANKLGVGNTLYKAYGAPVRLPDVLELSVHCDPGFGVLEYPVITLPPPEQPSLQPLP